VLASTPGGREELRRVVDPEFADLVDELEPKDLPAVWAFPDNVSATAAGLEVASSITRFRIDDDHGRSVGVCLIQKPAAGMSHLAAATLTADPAHLERMRLVERPIDALRRS
jgi:hypothetical protein